jgi:hypothetical protein
MTAFQFHLLRCICVESAVVLWPLTKMQLKVCFTATHINYFDEQLIPIYEYGSLVFNRQNRKVSRS